MPKIKIPKGILKASSEAICDSLRRRKPESLAKVSLQAALLHITNNPIVPTFDQLRAIFKNPTDGEIEWMITAIAKWQCRMFLDT